MSERSVPQEKPLSRVKSFRNRHCPVRQQGTFFRDPFVASRKTLLRPSSRLQLRDGKEKVSTAVRVALGEYILGIT